MPDIDDLVRVAPAPIHVRAKSPSSGVLKNHDRFLANEGEELPWTSFLAERYRTGEIVIVPPEDMIAPEDKAKLRRGTFVKDPLMKSE